MRVAWRSETQRFECFTCWPLTETTSREKELGRAFNEDWGARVLRLYGVPAHPDQTWAGHEGKLPERQPSRDAIYGPHIEDSLISECDFAVHCPCRGILGDGLTIGQARQLLQEHTHS